MKLTFPIPEDCLVLTVNQRLSRHLQLKDAEARMAQGQTIWPSPPIHSLADWFLDTYQNSWPDKWVLSSLQSQTLWETILESDSNYKSLDPLSLIGAARDAGKAYSLLLQYELEVDPGAPDLTEETRAMIRWKSAYEGFLEKFGAIGRDHVISRVGEQTASGRISFPQTVWLAGFDEITPAVRSWIKVAEHRGARFYFHEGGMDENESRISIMDCETVQEENIQCARWVRTNFKEGDRIGIVATRLNDIHRALERELKAELAPESIYVWEKPDLPFNVSLGYPLIKEPMIAPALILLESPSQAIGLDRFLEVIRSPYLSPAALEDFVADRLQSDLVRNKQFEVTFTAARQTIQTPKGKKQKESGQFSALKKLFREWEDFLHNKKSKSRNLPSVWARRFTELLVRLGWPAAHRKLDSREIQAYKEWEKRLDELASLDSITGFISRTEAAARLRKLVSDPERPFQVQTTEDSPIHLMGLLESAGQQFDHLWVLGCDADALPEPVRPNPFLPIKLQKRFRLPYSSAERQMEFARKLVGRLKTAAPNVVFSYSRTRDQQPMTVSPLVVPSSGDGLESISRSARVIDHIPPVGLETFDDSPWIPTSQAELKSIRRGFSTFKNQAECPFRAFSIIRLRADAARLPETNFEHVERGNIVHTVLEHFWKSVKSKSQLLSHHTRGTLDQAIDQAIQKTFQEKQFAALPQKEPRFFELEQNRLADLMREWLGMELKGPDFEVLGQEKKEQFDFEGFHLTIRVDRIDRLDNGKLLLIDYKTGKVSSNGWVKSPLQDIQLPLYALHLKSDGIAFAQVRKGECLMRSIQASEGKDGQPGLAGIRGEHPFENWGELTHYWEQELKRLAREFKEGRDDIMPVEDEKTCRNCLHGPLCRIEDLRQRLEFETEHATDQ